MNMLKYVVYMCGIIKIIKYIFILKIKIISIIMYIFNLVVIFKVCINGIIE